MALGFLDLGRDTFTNEGTGTITLDNSPPSTYVLPPAGVSPTELAEGIETDYLMWTADRATWEAGRGTRGAANTLSRDTVYQSSAADAAVTFPAGTKHIHIGPSATWFNRIEGMLPISSTYFAVADSTLSIKSDDSTAATLLMFSGASGINPAIQVGNFAQGSRGWIIYNETDDAWQFGVSPSANLAATEAFRIKRTGEITVKTGGFFAVNGVNTLSATTLGSAVVNSSLTGLGTITSGVWNGTAIEGTAIASTGESGGTKYLREDGDGTCSWQAVAGGGGSSLFTTTGAGLVTYLTDTASDVAFGSPGDATSPFYFDVSESQFFCVEGTSPAASLIGASQFHAVHDDTAGLQATTANDTDTKRPVNTFIRSRGTAASPTVVVENDRLGSMLFQGYGGTSRRNSSEIRAELDGSPTPGGMPGRLLLMTSEGASPTPLERVRIDSTGTTTFTKIVDSASVNLANFVGDRATPTAGDAAYIDLKLADSAGDPATFGRLKWTGTTVTAGSEAGKLTFSVPVAGVMTDLFTVSETDVTVDQISLHHGTVIANVISANAATIDFTKSNVQSLTLAAATADVTVTLTPPTGASKGKLILTQDNPARDITWAMTSGAGRWLQTERTWNGDPVSSIYVIEWTSDGTDMLLETTGPHTASF